MAGPGTARAAGWRRLLGYSCEGLVWSGRLLVALSPRGGWRSKRTSGSSVRIFCREQGGAYSRRKVPGEPHAVTRILSSEGISTVQPSFQEKPFGSRMS
jgi:hypothetical protein